MPLTDTAVRNAKPGLKVIRLKDDRGLHLEVSPKGGKYWRLRYWISGKERLISLGAYPDVSLKQARDRREDARRLIAEGVDPFLSRQADKAEAQKQADTFETVAREWHGRQSATWVAGHAGKIIRRFELYVFPWIGAKPIREIGAPDLLDCLRRVEAKGAVETAHRALQTCGQVFRYAIATGRADRDPAADIRGALTPAKETHRAAVLDPAGVGALMRAIDAYTGGFVTCCALKLAPLTFVRPGELRHGEWSEIDLDNAEWRIPGPKMKMREQHIVPLSRQAVAILRELQPLTGAGQYVFPSVRTAGRPMSEVTILAALRRLGYAKNEMTGHGFRAMASTLLNEAGWAPDVIERQLAHAERNKVRAAYNRASLLPERRKMMQTWADYLDQLRAGDISGARFPS